MTTTTAELTARPGDALTQRDRGALGDHLFRWVALAAGLLVLAVLALIAFSTTHEAWPALREAKAHFFTSKVWIPNDPDGDAGPLHPSYGALVFIYGTVVVSFIALLLAVPVSLGIALFVTEVAPRRVRSAIVTVLDLLAAVPSVVFGLWGIFVLAPNIVGFYEGVHGVFEHVPLLGTLFGPDAVGKSIMTAGIILAMMITPIITSIMREVLYTVPATDRDGALALGATRWEMIRGVVLPHSFGGMVGAVMLGLGRAMGETIAVLLVIGSAVQISGNVFKSGHAMPAIIVEQWGEATGVFRSSLMAIGVFLFVMTIIVNVSARVIVNRTERRLQGLG